jgi:glycopeptide antibiotics resistance protein
MMLVLRHPRTWLAIGWMLVIAATYVSLVPAKSLPPMGVSDKFEHAFGYAVLTLWFTGIYPRSRYLHIALGMFLLGVMIEYLQGAMHLGRSRDYHDIIANTGGIACGLLIARIALGGWAQWIESKVLRW